MFFVADYRDQDPAFDLWKIDPGTATSVFLFVFQLQGRIKAVNAHEGHVDTLGSAVMVAFLNDAFAKHVKRPQTRHSLPIRKNPAPLDARCVAHFQFLAGFVRHGGIRR